MYRSGLLNFLRTNKISTKFEVMVKSNELHTDQDARPWLIFNPCAEMKVVGSWIARFFIKLFK